MIANDKRTTSTSHNVRQKKHQYYWSKSHTRTHTYAGLNPCESPSFADRSLVQDPEYLALVELFASDLSYLDDAFAAAWYKLTSRDMGQFQRCVGTDVAPPQEFQLPLPEAPTDLPDTDGAKSAIMSIQSSDPSYPALFVTLAWQCASTYRSTDFLGGCNGARIRFPPESEWAGNQGLDQVCVCVCRGVARVYVVAL